MKKIIYYGCVENHKKFIEAKFNDALIKVAFIDDETKVIDSIKNDCPEGIVIEPTVDNESLFDFLMQIKEVLVKNELKLIVIVFTRISYEEFWAKKDIIRFVHYVSNPTFNYMKDVVNIF